nr:hypothetical protein [Micromonospora sp. DSM 115978]
RKVPREELAEDLTSADAQALSALIAARLVTLDRDTVELVHEALVREWPRLRDWVEADRAMLRARDQLRVDAEDWKQAGHEESRLYRGARLALAREAVEAAASHVVGRLARYFVQASAAAENAVLARR